MPRARLSPTDENIPSREPNDISNPDSDVALEQDDREAINKSNVIDSKTRHAKPSRTYQEPDYDEGLPGPDDGTSAVSGGPN